MTNPPAAQPHPDAQRYLVSSEDVPPDGLLSPEQGWIDMEVRWLITRDTVGSEKTVIGRTVLTPGAKHDIHRHPHAEEWEFVVSGEAIKHIGDDRVRMRPGDVVLVPENVYHGLENASDTEPVVTIWGYSGAASLGEAGYLLPSDSTPSKA